jgi:hypothetical protein
MSLSSTKTTELYAELAKVRAVMEHIAWLLDTNAIRKGRSLPWGRTEIPQKD